MTRIVGGRFGGRRLTTPAGAQTRPTAEKVRAALANSLASTGGLDGARVLDLYAGSGALALELISRGARSAVLVDSDRAAVSAARANVDLLGAGRRRSRSSPATRWPQRAGRCAEPFDVVVADPPYDLPDADLLAVLTALHRAGNLVARRRPRGGARRALRRAAAGRSRSDGRCARRRYGDTLLCYGRAPMSERACARSGAAQPMTHAVCPGSFDPPTLGPPGHRRPGRRPVRPGDRGRPGQPGQTGHVHRRGTDRSAAGRGAHRGPTSTSTRSAACSSTTAPRTASRRSSRVCAPSPTSTTNCRWPR